MRPFPSYVRTAVVLAVILAGAAVTVTAARLYPAAAAEWTAYVSATEARIDRELASSRGFLVLDFSGDAVADRRDILNGAVIVRPMQTTDSGGAPLRVSSALVHHWRGEVLIPGITAQQLLAQLQEGPPPTRQEDVLQSRVLERGRDRMKVYLKLQRRTLVTAVYNTEHVVTFGRQGTARATSTSRATKIAEVSDPGSERERELAPGDDRGFLWRLNAYWRYQEVPGGVIAECESISLSRDVPSVVRYLVNPLIERTARESMERTLVALRAGLAKT